MLLPVHGTNILEPSEKGGGEMPRREKPAALGVKCIFMTSAKKDPCRRASLISARRVGDFQANKLRLLETCVSRIQVEELGRV